MAQPSPNRLDSIDALRGFVMFWIIGGDQIAPLLAKIHPSSFMETLAAQFDHVPWNGLVFYDLIFPTFMFLAGVSMPFAFEKYASDKSALYRKIFWRTLALVCLGIVYNGALKFEGWEAVRWPGVLQRIGITYGLGSLIYLNFGPRGRAAWAAGILLGYWAVMAWVPVPGLGAGVLTPEGNLAGWLDRALIPGWMCCYEQGDNEGILSTIPAVVTVVLGGFAGAWLKSARDARSKALGLALAGIAAFALGWAWNPLFPVNKNLWSSSFTLAAGGCSALMLSAFYWLMDVKGWKAWAFAFVLIGMNSITIYLGQEMIDFGYSAKFLCGGLAAHLGAYKDLSLALADLGLKIGLLYFLWRQRVFLKV